MKTTGCSGTTPPGKKGFAAFIAIGYGGKEFCNLIYAASVVCDELGKGTSAVLRGKSDGITGAIAAILIQDYGLTKEQVRLFLRLHSPANRELEEFYGESYIDLMLKSAHDYEERIWAFRNAIAKARARVRANNPEPALPRPLHIPD